MCGILFCCSQDKPLSPSQTCLESLQRRGPDDHCTISKFVAVKAASTEDPAFSQGTQSGFLTFTSTVLSLRGDTIVSQPLENSESGSLLCWNGEAWKIHDSTVDGNDAEIVFNMFLNCTRTTLYDQALQNILNLVAHIVGPYCFVFYDAQHQRVFYGRDALGRRSLTIKKSLQGSLVISSVCDAVDDDSWMEIEADGMYMLDLQEAFKPSLVPPKGIVHIPWLSPFPNFNCDLEGAGNYSLTLSSPAVDHLSQKLRSSLSLRLQNLRVPPSGTSRSARIAILFSGGLDCTVLARVAHEIIPQEQEIDLLNIAFENPRVIQAATPNPFLNSSSPFARCPDRITGLSSCAEVLSICPDRTWRFVAIDVTYTELQAHRAQIISLIHPHNTEMDFSIACALYFAARGSGTAVVENSTSAKSYSTPARILLSGLGADELFGGYTRHATAFNRRGYAGLVSELQLDFSRLGKRNLGRDDRVISHWGKEVRYPYLDEDLVSWALSIPVWQKCGFGQSNYAQESEPSPALEPGKKVLRLLAWKLGLHGPAVEKKRAIQFGARTAKMESGKRKGTAILNLDP